jgi:DNA-binding transcriptional MerR regulator
MDGLTVSQVAKLAGVSVRTLHHYDEIGLLCPSERSSGGYRLYGDEELQRLQQILFFKELAFPLEEIARIMKDPAFDLRAALLLQRRLLEEKAVRIQALLGAVDAALQSIERGTVMTNEERFEVFGDFDPAKYEKEAEQRWGNSPAYKESKRRTARYGKQEWLQIKAEAQALNEAFLAAMAAGVKPTDAKAMDLAEQHRQHISKWFYACTEEIHRGLAEMYVADARFTENIDKAGPGLAAYMRQAILANASRLAKRK